MSQPSPETPVPKGGPGPTEPRRVGRVSEYLGSRLVVVGLVSGAAGLVLLGFAGWRAWRGLVGHHVGSDLASVVVFGALAFALISVGGSARKTGGNYLTGHRSVASDIGRFVAKRATRRRR